jgi:probable HAF family extracellular repeat protein
LIARMMCASLLALPAMALPVYQVQAIGPAGAVSTATAINGSGAVAGNYFLVDGTSRAFLWQDGQLTTLPLPNSAVQTWATAISGDAQAGGYTDSLQGAYGVIWDSQSNTLTTAGAYVMGMNDAGDAAGLAIGADGAGYAFSTRNGVTTALGQPAGGDWASANAINADGAVAGTAMDASGAFRAFTVSREGVATVIGSAGSYAMAIAASGAVAGHSRSQSGALQATVWNATAATLLGTLGGANSFAYGINASGYVVGYSDTLAGQSAFLFANGQLIDLNSLLAPDSGWQLLSASAINDAGQIVGHGLYNGREQAFLLNPSVSSAAAPSSAEIPEPSTLWLAGPPLLAYFALRSRHR